MRSTTKLSSPLRLSAVVATFLAGTELAAQDNIHSILEKNDTVFAGGATYALRSVTSMAVSDNGRVYAEVLTDNANKKADTVVLLDGWTVIQESSPVLVPGGFSTIERFLDIDVNAHDDVAWPLDLAATSPLNNSNDSGIFWNAILVAQEGSPILATDTNGQAFVVQPTYARFDGCKINDDATMLVTGQIRIGGATHLALWRMETDGATGTLLDEDMLFVEDFTFPATGETITGVGPGGNATNSMALNNNGDYLGLIKVGTDRNKDSMLIYNGQILFREGDNSTLVPGRTYNDLNGIKMDLNDHGEYVTTLFLDISNTTDNAMLVVNGEILSRKGSSLPAIEGNIDRYEASPMYISNSGDVYWYCNTVATSADKYYMRNGDIIIRESITNVGSGPISGLRNSAYNFHVSKSGRFWVAEVDLNGGNEALVMADFGAILRLPGCYGNTATLEENAATSGDAVLGQTVRLQMDNGQASNVIPVIYWSLAPAIPGSRCGRNRPYGEVFINPGAIVAKSVTGTTWSPGDPPVDVSLSIPVDSGLVDLKVWGQGVFFDFSPGAAVPFQLTNGLLLEIGAP